MASMQVGLCPRHGCDARVTLPDLQAVETGEPLWQCADGHAGPRVPVPERQLG